MRIRLRMGSPAGAGERQGLLDVDLKLLLILEDLRLGEADKAHLQTKMGFRKRERHRAQD